MRITLYLRILLIFISCSSLEKGKEMNIINLKSNFKNFWSEAKGESFETQIKAWEKHIETEYEDLYSSLLWNKKHRKDWQGFRKEKLKLAFEKYATSYNEIIKNFDSFEETLLIQIKKYKELFPDADFSKTPIYVMPSIGAFNGKGASLESNPEQTILFFGIDLITWRKDDPDILYSHELFHIYHIARMKVDEKVFTEDGKLTLPLWLEGLATWVSGEFNKEAPLSALMMDEEYEKIDKSKVHLLAKEFLKDANSKAFDEKDPLIYKKWFAVGVESAVKGMPNRLGYFLGNFVIDEIAKNNDLGEMTKWEHDRVHQEVLIALKKL